MAKLRFYYSAMNAGKTATLLQSAFNYQERGMDVRLFTPAVDDRSQVGKIVSRTGLEQDAIVFDHNFNFLDDLKDQLQESEKSIRCLFIDGAHFLSKAHVEQLAHIVDVYNIPVLAYGLRSDFRGEPFEGSLYLLLWAEEVAEIKTICLCGRKATMNVRIDAQGQTVREGPQTEAGWDDRYVSFCRRHFRERMGTSL